MIQTEREKERERERERELEVPEIRAINVMTLFG